MRGGGHCVDRWSGDSEVRQAGGYRGRSFRVGIVKRHQLDSFCLVLSHNDPSLLLLPPPSASATTPASSPTPAAPRHTPHASASR